MRFHPGAGRGRSVDPFRGRGGAYESRPAGEGARREPRCVYRVQASPRRCRGTPDRRGAGQRGTALCRSRRLEWLDRSAPGRQPRSAHDDITCRVRGVIARASRRRLRPTVLFRLGADDRFACLRSRKAADSGPACGRRADPLPPLSRPANPAALRPGNPGRAALTAGFVARRAACAHAAIAGIPVPPPRPAPLYAAIGRCGRGRTTRCAPPCPTVTDLMRAPYRVIAITGASSGLGAALAAYYAGPGVVLGLVARNRERLARTEAACRAAGARVESAAIDVANTAAMTAWLGEFDSAHPVELLIANAGTSAGPDPDSPGEPA